MLTDSNILNVKSNIKYILYVYIYSIYAGKFLEREICIKRLEFIYQW